mmetsp:Transcript_1217/g.2924  ORF Transcript_1217/g.2924 Transcript_1217/m.2924 type:complete len:213 (-) Transcript_1217:71-709(-)
MSPEAPPGATSRQSMTSVTKPGSSTTPAASPPLPPSSPTRSLASSKGGARFRSARCRVSRSSKCDRLDRTSRKAPPPRPELEGLATPRHRAVATAASMAFPPSLRRMSVPTREQTGVSLATDADRRSFRKDAEDDDDDADAAFWVGLFSNPASAERDPSSWTDLVDGPTTPVETSSSSSDSIAAAATARATESAVRRPRPRGTTLVPVASGS